MLGPLDANLSPLGLARMTFSPRQIAGLRVWLRADALTGLADGDPVALWPDVSGNAADAAQGDPALQPAYRAGARNGWPALECAGGQAMVVPSLTLAAFTFLAIGRAANAAIAWEHSADSDAGDGSAHFTGTGYQFAAQRSGVADRFDVDVAFADGTWRVVAQQFDGTGAGHAAWVDGAAQGRTASAPGDPGAATVTADLYLFGRAAASMFLAGQVAELLVYDAALADADRARVERYLIAKYAIGLA